MCSLVDHKLVILYISTEFLSYVRSIFEGNLGDVPSSIPLESDSHALEFLANCNNDVYMAKLLLHSSLSHGKGSKDYSLTIHLEFDVFC